MEDNGKNCTILLSNTFHVGFSSIGPHHLDWNVVETTGQGFVNELNLDHVRETLEMSRNK
jgi:hypothetical protein